MKKQKPVNLDLWTIRFPVTAIVSILHRVSGVIMFFALGLLLWLLAKSLSSADGFAFTSGLFGSGLGKVVMWGILTALAYHVAAGIRHLIMDFGYCEELVSGERSAKAVFVATILLSVFAGVWVW